MSEIETEVVVPTMSDVRNVDNQEFTNYLKDKISHLHDQCEYLSHQHVKLNRYNLALVIPQMIINAGMTSTVMFEQNSSHMDTSRHVIIGLGIVNIVLQSVSNSFKYGHKSQKAKEKQKSCRRLQSELEMCLLVNNPTAEYKEEIMNRVVSSNLC